MMFLKHFGTYLVKHLFPFSVLIVLKLISTDCLKTIGKELTISFNEIVGAITHLLFLNWYVAIYYWDLQLQLTK